MRGRTLAVMSVVGAVLWMGGSAANADCRVERRQTAGKSLRVIKCDASQRAIDDAIARGSASCTTSTGDLASSCYDAVAESYRLRREAMLRRTLKEGASITAAARLHGYTEEEVERWLAKNMPTDRGYNEPVEDPAAVLQVQRDLANLGLAR